MGEMQKEDERRRGDMKGLVVVLVSLAGSLALLSSYGWTGSEARHR